MRKKINKNHVKLNDDKDAVSPVIATILMVAITVVLSGVLYVWASELAGSQTDAGSLNNYTVEEAFVASSDGKNDTLLRMAFSNGPEDLKWSFLTVTLFDETDGKTYKCSPSGEECSISEESVDDSWAGTEIITISESSTDICSIGLGNICELKVSIQYKGKTIAGNSNPIKVSINSFDVNFQEPEEPEEPEIQYSKTFENLDIYGDGELYKLDITIKKSSFKVGDNYDYSQASEPFFNLDGDIETEYEKYIFWKVEYNFDKELIESTGIVYIDVADNDNGRGPLGSSSGGSGISEQNTERTYFQSHSESYNSGPIVKEDMINSFEIMILDKEDPNNNPVVLEDTISIDFNLLWLDDAAPVEEFKMKIDPAAKTISFDGEFEFNLASNSNSGPFDEGFTLNFEFEEVNNIVDYTSDYHIDVTNSFSSDIIQYVEFLIYPDDNNAESKAYLQFNLNDNTETSTNHIIGTTNTVVSYEDISTNHQEELEYVIEQRWAGNVFTFSEQGSTEINYLSHETISIDYENTVNAPMTIWEAGVPHAKVNFNSMSVEDKEYLTTACGLTAFEQTDIINYLIDNEIEMTVKGVGQSYTFKITSIHVPSENQNLGEGYTGIYLDPRPETDGTVQGEFQITFMFL